MKSSEFDMIKIILKKYEVVLNSKKVMKKSLTLNLIAIGKN